MGGVRPLALVFASALTLAINGVGLYLLLTLNAFMVMPRVDPPQKMRPAIQFREPPPQEQKPEPRREVKRPVERQSTPPLVPHIPSSIVAPRLGEPEVDLVNILRPVIFDEISRQPDLILTEEAVDVPPQVRYRVPPTYPPRAEAAGITGHVTLRLLVSREGVVEQVHVEQAEPVGIFDTAAQRAVWKWRFEPAQFRGQPVAVWVRQRMAFVLD